MNWALNRTSCPAKLDPMPLRIFKASVACMLPMMPIVVTVILGRHDDAHPISHSRGFMLALFYVLGMAITYSVAGVFAGLSGTLVSGILQNPWVLSSFALIYVVLAGGMLGFPPF